MVLAKSILFYIVVLPIIGIFFILWLNPNQKRASKLLALNTSCSTFIGFLLSLLLNLNFVIGIDGISIFFFIVNFCINVFFSNFYF